MKLERALMAVIALVVAWGAVGQLAAQNRSNPTGTQGVVGNPNCPPPRTGGPPPRNWSCPTGTQRVPQAAQPQQANPSGRHCTLVNPVRQYVRNTQQLAQVVWSGYRAEPDGRHYPIFAARIVRFLGVPGLGQGRNCNNCWLLALAGYDSAQDFSFVGDVNNLAGTLAKVIPVPAMIDGYAMAVANAVNELGIQPNAVVLMAGHSLGGITAQNLIYYAASNQILDWPPQTNVLTFGSPIMLYHIPDAALRRQLGVDSAALTDKYADAQGGAHPVFTLSAAGGRQGRDARLRFFAIGSDRVVISPAMIHFELGGLFQFENIQRFRQRDRSGRLVWLGATMANVDPHDAYPLDSRLRAFDPLGADRPTDVWEIALDPNRQYRCSSKFVGNPDSRVPLASVPGIAQFGQWFDSISADDFDRYWANPALRQQIEDRLRYPGTMHEWLVVSRADDFHRWGVHFADIQNCRTPTSQVTFLCPVRGTGSHDDAVGSECHMQIISAVDQSLSFEEFRGRLQDFARQRLPGGVNDLVCPLLTAPVRRTP